MKYQKQHWETIYEKNSLLMLAGMNKSLKIL